MSYTISKAFYTVETGVLLHELKQCGVMGKLGCWLSSFLDSKNRHQAVAVDGRVSPLTPVLSGVPQGTVLGPVLFLVHIRNISKKQNEIVTNSFQRMDLTKGTVWEQSAIVRIVAS